MTLVPFAVRIASTFPGAESEHAIRDQLGPSRFPTKERRGGSALQSGVGICGCQVWDHHTGRPFGADVGYSGVWNGTRRSILSSRDDILMCMLGFALNTWRCAGRAPICSWLILKEDNLVRRFWNLIVPWRPGCPQCMCCKDCICPARGRVGWCCSALSCYCPMFFSLIECNLRTSQDTCGIFTDTFSTRATQNHDTTQNRESLQRLCRSRIFPS